MKSWKRIMRLLSVLLLACLLVSCGAAEQTQEEEIDMSNPDNWDEELYDRERVNVYRLYVTDEEADFLAQALKNDKCYHVDPVRIVSQWRTPYSTSRTYIAYYEPDREYYGVKTGITADGKPHIIQIGPIRYFPAEQYVEATDGTITDVLQEIWDNAGSNGRLNGLTPEKLLATQFDQGMNYRYLAVASDGTEKEVTIYVRADGRHSVAEIVEHVETDSQE